MSDELSFLEAIRNRPGSLAERFVYADWLTDQGNPRGEFIHLQCRAHKMAYGDHRRLELDARCNELLFQHEEAWLGPLLGHIGNWEWRLGMLDWITVDTTVFLAQAEHWLPSLPLLGVHLRRAGTHMRTLAKCPQLAHVTSLFLGDDRLTDDQLKALLRSRYLRRLRTLYLQNNRLTDESATTLATTAALPKLRDLNLADCMLTGVGVMTLARSLRLRRLRQLNLMMTRFGETPLQELYSSPLFGRLREINLGMNMLTPGQLTQLARSPAAANLRRLLYPMNQPADSDVIALAESPHVANLRTLSLQSYQNLGDSAFQALANSPNLSQLRHLDLGSGSWTVVGVRALACSRQLTGLRTLRITQTNESRGVAKVLFGRPLIRRLRELTLNVGNVSRGAIKALASHPKPLRLCRLQLPLVANVGDAWEELLAKGTLAQLGELEVDNLPPGGLRAMCVPGRFPSVRQLRLFGIPKDPDEFQALLDSPLWRQLHSFQLSVNRDDEEEFATELIRRMKATWSASMTSLGLLWSLSPEQVRLLTQGPAPSRLMELTIGSFRMKAEGAVALANWPHLRHLRQLLLVNASSHTVVGLGALAESPHVGPLLRIDIRNGHVGSADVPALRKRMGMRVAVGGRYYPRVMIIGSWRELVGDGLD